MRNTAVTLALASLTILAGCAGSNKQEVKWSGSMGSYFENAVRPGEPPRRLWENMDEELLLRRMGYADAVAVGTIKLVNGVERRGTAGQVALAFRPREVLYGSLDQDRDSDRQLRLRLDPTAADYRLARRIQSQLPGTHYLLFLKRRPRRDGGHDLRWAFYKPRRKLMAEVRARYRMLKQSGEKARAHLQKEREIDDESIGDLLETPEPAREPRTANQAEARGRSSSSDLDEPGFLGQEP